MQREELRERETLITWQAWQTSGHKYADDKGVIPSFQEWCKKIGFKLQDEEPEEPMDDAQKKAIIDMVTRAAEGNVDNKAGGNFTNVDKETGLMVDGKKETVKN